MSVSGNPAAKPHGTPRSVRSPAGTAGTARPPGVTRTRRQAAKRMALLMRCVTLSAAALAAGCSSDAEDLRAWMNGVRARPAGGIDPLPAVGAAATFVYEPAGRRSPFVPDTPLAAASAAPTPARDPAPDRPREYLEQFPLDALRMVGTLEARGALFGLVRTTDGLIHRVGVGQRLGRNNGLIVSITESGIALVESSPDERGGRLERAAELRLAD